MLLSTTTPNNYYTIFFTLSDDVYYWRVRAKDVADNWGDWSDIWSFKIDTVGPYIVSPDDIVFEEGTIGNNFSWFPQDDNPSSYIVYYDESILFSGIWNTSGEEIFINLDGLSIDIYNFTLYFEDAVGNSRTDTVIVTVIEVVISEFSSIMPVLMMTPLFMTIVLVIIKRKKKVK